MMTREDAFDANLGRMMKHLPDVTGAPPEFSAALLERTRAELGRRPRRLWIPLAAAAAILLLLGGAWLALRGTPDADRTFARYPTVASARGASGAGRTGGLFEIGEEEAELEYLDPVAYMAENGVDPSIPGLMAYYREAAAGGPARRNDLRSACIDALVTLVGRRATPLLIQLFEEEPDSGGRYWILRGLQRTADVAALPYLTGVIDQVDPTLLVTLTHTLASFGVKDPESARRLRARLSAARKLDAASEAFNPSEAAGALRSLALLGEGAAKTEAARLLAIRPHPALLALTPENHDARRKLTEAAFGRKDPTFEDVALLAVLGKVGDSRFIPLLRKLLGGGYVEIQIDAARVAGRCRRPEAMASLREAIGPARIEDETVPMLWASARCGDPAAIHQLLDFLGRADDSRQFEWCVDALLDLGASGRDLMAALPDKRMTLTRLVPILDRGSDAVSSVPSKAASLTDGALKKALTLVRDLGYTPAVRRYLDGLSPGERELDLILSFGDLGRIQAVMNDPATKPHVRIFALRAVPMVRGAAPAKVALAAKALSSGDAGVRKAAVDVLVEMDTADAAHALAVHFPRESDPRRRTEILLGLAAHPEALLQCGAAVAPTDASGWRAFLDAVGQTRRPEARAWLEAGLRHSEARVRRVAAFYLAQRGEMEALALLLREAEGPDPVASVLAEEALLTLGRTELVPVWIRSLRSTDRVRRGRAAGRLQAVTGETLGLDPAAWERWWSANRGRFRLEPARARPPVARPGDLFEQEEW